MPISLSKALTPLSCAAILWMGGCAVFPEAQTVYRGGEVWSGESFDARDFAVIDGRIATRFRIGEQTAAVPLDGGFVVPALANGHEHLTYPTEAQNATFLEKGVYYVWNPNILGSALDKDFTRFFARPDTIELKTSAGGVTEPKSHPEPLYVDILGPRVYGGKGFDALYGDAFHYGRSEEEITRTLDTLVTQGADFVKIYLLGSEDYAPPAADGTPQSTTGLDPQNVPFLVKEAHQRGLPVIAHLETRYDFRVAAEAGVDFAGHLPGYGVTAPENAQSRLLTEADVAAAKASGMAVMPTYALGGYRAAQALEKAPDDAEAIARAETTKAVQRRNLSALHEAGVPIVAGTDLSPGLLLVELKRWEEIGALTAEEVFRAAIASGPRLFPERRIGCLDQGCEADFLVLEEDPRERVEALEDIILRVKAGDRLDLPAGAQS